MRVVYVHGFGGRVVDPKLADALRERGAQLQIRSPVVSYSWRSGWLNRNVTLPEWVEAKADAEKEAERLALAVSKDSTATHLVAFSLGCWLVLHALKDLRTVPDHLRSIFLLGAAVPYDYDLTDIGWHRDVLAINYYSPDIDFVLRRVYARIEGVPAAGVKGFLQGDEGRVPIENLPVRHGHTWRRHRRLADSIFDIVAWREGHRSKKRPNTKQGRVRAGKKYFWDTVFRREGKMIQAHTLFNHARLVDERGGHVRIADAADVLTLMPILFGEASDA